MAGGWSADIAAAVYARLATLDRVAAGLRSRTAAEERVRADLAGLLVSWRRLLDLHAADEDGRCPQCRGWVRRRRWPCPAWKIAHYYLITSGVAVGCPAAPDPALVPYPRETGAPPAGRALASRARPGSFQVIARLPGRRR